MKAWDRHPAALWIPIVLLGAGSYWIPRPWSLAAFALGVGWAWGWTSWRGMVQAVQWARRLRHRSANQLQVVAGWLELGRVDRAEESLQRINRLLAEETGRWAGLSALWAYALLEAEQTAEAHGVECRWEGRVRSELGWWGLIMFRYALSRVLPRAGEQVTVRFGAPAGFCLCWHLGPKPPPRLWGGFKADHRDHTICVRWGRLGQVLPPAEAGLEKVGS
ncbi:MAG: Spo0B domain-containing protein [Firmicutes bacterium]|nr:Spo0B domain-containing protein [Bacillota bacterium]